MAIIDNLNWRYATKTYDPTKKLSPEQREILMEALRLTPSSFGLQGWKFIHVTDEALREQLKPAAYGQSATTDASELFVFAIPTNFNETNVNVYIASLAKARGVTVESLSDSRAYLANTVKQKTPEAVQTWLARQVYIALGIGLSAAAEMRVDSTPMEGFDNAKFDEILGLNQLGLKSVVMLAVGFRSAEDKTQRMPKSRFTKNEVFIER